MSSNIDQMQQGLEKALQAAAQADDRELAGRVREEGRRLVFILNGLLRTSRLHDKDNAAFEAPSKEFAVTLNGLLDLLGAVHVVCVEDQIYVNDIRLRGNPREQQVIESFVLELARHHVGGMSFHGPLQPEGVREVAQLIAAPPADESPRTTLERKLSGFGDIVLTGTHRFRIGGEPTQEKKDYDEAMRRGATVVAEAVQNLAADRIPNPLPIRRAVIDMVTSLREDPVEGSLEPFRRTAGRAGEQHLLSVTSLALTLGEALELPEGALSDLGVAAMLHDIGYTKVPDRTGHCAAGARLLLKQRGFHEAKIRRVLMVLEHHDPYTPKEAAEGLTRRERLPCLFARILKIANDYDLLVSPRPNQPPPMSPSMALARMWAARETEYDPNLLALFAQTLGLFPPGTLLELTDGRWVVSVTGARDKERFSWPLVRVVREADGTFVDAVEEIDLYETRAYLRPARILDPSKMGVDVGKHVARPKKDQEEAQWEERHRAFDEDDEEEPDEVEIVEDDEEEPDEVEIVDEDDA